MSITYPTHDSKTWRGTVSKNHYPLTHLIAHIKRIMWVLDHGASTNRYVAKILLRLIERREQCVWMMKGRVIIMKALLLLLKMRIALYKVGRPSVHWHSDRAWFRVVRIRAVALSVEIVLRIGRPLQVMKVIAILNVIVTVATVGNHVIAHVRMAAVVQVCVGRMVRSD